ncbi:MAG: PQQ-binding-like beta-propeller repeat protein [Verrucomicrobiota bacterium]
MLNLTQALPAATYTRRFSTRDEIGRRLLTRLAIPAALALGTAGAGAALTEAWVQRTTDAAVNESGQAVAVDGSGNVVVGGSWGGDYYTVKYAAADGAVIWQKRSTGLAGSSDTVRALAVDRNGDVIVTGSSLGAASQTDFHTVKYAAADGAQLWEKRYNGPGNGEDVAIAVAVDSRGDVVVTGTSNNGTAGSGTDPNGNDYYTAKYSSLDGTLLWEKRYNGPANRADASAAVAMDSGGNPVVTGSSRSDSNGDGLYDNDYYTAKYAAADGALIWEQRYNGLLAFGDIASAIAVDPAGNVVVTGSSGGYYTVKYAAADGALLWSKRYTGPGAGGDSASAVAVDGNGNVVVTGSSVSGAPAQDFDYYTAKYAAADGALLWEKRYNGAANGDDRARAVAVDAAGNVVVTGSSYETPAAFDSFGDYYTAKYASADGALLWERRYNGPANGGDSASSLALAPNGLLAVTGSSDGDAGTGINSDVATVVYREIPAPLSFAGWVAGFGLYGAAASADADPDSDGLLNAVEYVLGGIPTTPDVSSQPIMVTASGGITRLTFSRSDVSETTDISLTVGTGTDLVIWPGMLGIGATTATSSAGVSINENGTDPDLISVLIPSGNGSRYFTRLQVTIAP